MKSVEAVETATEVPLTEAGRDIEVTCEARAFYEVGFRLRTQGANDQNAALVQFLFDDGRSITEEHVSAGFSDEVGRYSYLAADPETGLGAVRFFAPAEGGRIRLRFRAWANRHPVFMGRDLSVRRLSGWTIAAEPGSREPVRLTSEARPLSVPVPAGSTVWLRLGLRSEADGGKVVLHAPGAMTLDGKRLRLGEAPGGSSGSARPFAGQGTGIVLPVENTGRTPVILSLACEGAPVVDLIELAVLDKAKARMAAGAARMAPPALAPATPPLIVTSSPAAGGKRGGFQGIRKILKRVGDRLFLRSTVFDTNKELKLATAKVSQIERLLEDSLLLVEKKLDYALAKIDAYAEVDDRNGAALQDELAAVRRTGEELGKSVSAGQKAVNTRLATIELGNADLADKLAILRQAGQELKEAVSADQAELRGRLDATDARLAAVQAGNAELADALATRHEADQAELRSRLEMLDGRLAAIKKSEAELAGVVEAGHSHFKQALQDIGGRTKKLEEMDKRLLKLAAPKKPEPAPIEPASEGQATVLVEVLGPSGIGKSTILRAAQALRTPKKMWWGADEIDATIAAAGKDRLKQREAVDGFSPADFVPRCLEIIESSAMLPSQKISAINQLRETCQAAVMARDLSSRHPLVHDELLLHRASTLLLYSQAFEDRAAWYFDTVPVPEAAIIIRADVDIILERIRGRQEKQVNTYYNLDDDALRRIVGRSLRLTDIAAERLRGRGVAVTEIDANLDRTESARLLHDFVCSRRAKTPRRRAAGSST